MKARKLKLGINMDNGWIYCAYQKRVQGPVALGVISLDNIFFNLLCFLLITICTSDLLQGNLYHTCSAGLER